MSVYNSEKFLEESVNAVLSQTYSNFEFIIVDDGSTDSSIKIITQFEDSRIKLLINRENQGLAASLNKAIKAAKGKYVARIDADDICYKQRLKRQVDFMEKNSETDICGGFVKRISKEGKVFQAINSYPLKDRQIKADTVFGPRLFHPTVMFRTTFLLQNEVQYDISYKKAQDFELWSRLVFESNAVFANIPAFFVKYRDIQNRKEKLVRNKLQNEYANNIRIKNLQRLRVAYAPSHHTVNKLINSNLSKYETLKFLILLQEINKKSYARFGAYPKLNNIVKIQQFGFWGIKMFIVCKLYRNLILLKQFKLIFFALVQELKLKTGT